MRQVKMWLAVLVGLFIPFALGKDRKRINVKGGGTWLARELSPTPVDGFSDWGVVESIAVITDAGMIDIMDAAGNALEYISGQNRVGVEVTLMQTTFDEITLARLFDGRYYDCLYNVLLQNGETQQWSFCLLKFAPGATLTFQGSTKRSLKLIGVSLAPKAAFTRTPTNFNVVANTPYIVYQNLTPAATPSDTAATMATTII